MILKDSAGNFFVVNNTLEGDMCTVVHGECKIKLEFLHLFDVHTFIMECLK
jgi:hypothetical protein